MKRLVLALLALGAVGAVQAQAIYRCGQTYSQKPCPEGKLIDSADPRSAAQRAEAKRVAVKEKQLAAKMEQERKAREAGTAASQAGTLTEPAAQAPSAPPAPKPRVKPKTKAHKARAASGADFTAVVPPAKPGSK